MTKDILTDVAYIPKIENPTTEYIENYLNTKYGNIIRWAVIDISDNKLKIDVTYENKRA